MYSVEVNSYRWNNRANHNEGYGAQLSSDKRGTYPTFADAKKAAYDAREVLLFDDSVKWQIDIIYDIVQPDDDGFYSGGWLLECLENH